MVDKVLKKYESKIPLSDGDIKILLGANQNEREKIFALARKVRERYFGNEVFLYGFVYFSTFCKNNCNFCFYRRNNGVSPRYRKSAEEIINAAVRLANSGVHLIDLTMGEDRYFQEHFDELVNIVKEVKAKTRLAAMVSPGVLSDGQIKQLANAGADWYALYQETHSRELFRKLRVEQSYDERMNCKKTAKSSGMLIEEGLLTGVGETADDKVHSFREMQRISASQVRVMTFVSQKNTPMETPKIPDFSGELLDIAIMRLLFPDKLIPASLDVDGISGLEQRLMAGANVVTSIIPPNEGLAGVAQSELDIDDGHRTVSGISDTILKCGLKISTPQKYRETIEELRYEYSDNRLQASGG